jgi:hypothetical protein
LLVMPPSAPNWQGAAASPSSTRRLQRHGVKPSVPAQPPLIQGLKVGAPNRSKSPSTTMGYHVYEHVKKNCWVS